MRRRGVGGKSILGTAVIALAMGLTFFVSRQPQSTTANQIVLPTSMPESGAVQIATFFSREGQHPEKIVAADIHSAKSEVVTAMYSFTQPDIWTEYEALPARGVKLTLLTDQAELRLNKAQQDGVANLCSHGVAVRKNIAKGRQLEHLKLTVIDGRIGLVGSYNYTVSATGTNDSESNANDEILIRYVSPTYVSAWRDHIMRMYNDSSWSVDACQASSPTPNALPGGSEGVE